MPKPTGHIPRPTPLLNQPRAPLYCVLCLQTTVREQLEAMKNNVPVEEIMVTAPNLALTVAAVQVPTDRGMTVMPLPVCQMPDHLGVSV